MAEWMKPCIETNTEEVPCSKSDGHESSALVEGTILLTLVPQTGLKAAGLLVALSHAACLNSFFL